MLYKGTMFEKGDFKFCTNSSVMLQKKCCDIRGAAIGSNTLFVIDLLETNKIDVNNVNLFDESKQTLLHIAVKTKNYMLVEYLLGKNIDKDCVNIFGECALDIAIKNNDKKMIELLYDIGTINYHKNNNNKLEDKCDDLRFNYEKVLGFNDKLQREKSELISDLNMQMRKCAKLENENLGLVTNLDREMKNNKRLREDNDVCVRDLKKLKIDHQILTDTYNKLRDCMKK